MTLKHQFYMRMTANEMHNAMVKRKMTVFEMNVIKNIVREQKAALRSEAARKAQHDVLWRNLWHPLSYEIRIVRSMRSYKNKAYHVPERNQAITLYLKILDKLMSKLKTAHRAGTHTPKQLAVETKLPNNGEHWTDWIPQTIRQQVVDAFDAIPARFKAKTKTPFVRSIPVEQNDKLKAKLRARTEKELVMAERQAMIDPDEQETVARIRQALNIIDAMGDDETVPHTWHGLFK